MGGKRKAESQSKARSQAKAKAKAIPALPPPAERVASTRMNSELQAKLAHCDSVIKNKFGGDLMNGSPVTGGVPAYGPVQAANRLGAGESYVASVPFYWLNTVFEMQPNVPRYESRIHALKDHFFAKPARPDSAILVHVSPGEMPHQLVGALKAVDPPEMRDAFQFAIAEAIQSNAARATLSAWKEILMSVEVRFEAALEQNLAKTQFHIMYLRHMFYVLFINNIERSLVDNVSQCR